MLSSAKRPPANIIKGGSTDPLARISIGCYTIRITDKNTKENLPLGAFKRKGDLKRVLRRFLKERRAEYSVDGERQKLLRVQEFRTKGRRISGIVVTGEYGYEADLYNVDTAEVSYQRNNSDAEMMPFYFLMELPVQHDEGVILLQRRSNLGIRTAFLRDFGDFFKERYPNLKISFNTLVPPELVNEYLKNGRLTKMRFIRYTIPSDRADAYDGLGHVEEEGTAEMVFTPRRGDSLSWLGRRVRDVLDGKREITELVEFPEFEYENVKVELAVGGSRKTLDLSNTMKMNPYVDVTPDVKLGEDGHPEFNSIEDAALELLDSLGDKLGRGERNV